MYINADNDWKGCVELVGKYRRQGNKGIGATEYTNESDSTCTVSYTHLDVYKRQL